MFGLNKKAIAGFILLNIVVLGSIGYYGIKMDQLNRTQSQNPKTVGGYTLSSDQGDIFWVNTKAGGEDPNAPGIATQQYFLYRLTNSGQIMQYVLFNSSINKATRTASLLQIIDGKIYIFLSAPLYQSGADTNSFVLELTISQLPIGDQQIYSNFDGKIAVVDNGNSQNYLHLEKSGAITIPEGNRPHFTGLWYFHLSDLDFGAYAFSPKLETQLTSSDLGVQTYDLATQATNLVFGFRFINYQVDANNNVIVRGYDYTLTANLDSYNAADNSTANYIQMPYGFHDPNQRIINLFDDGNNFYLVYKTKTRIDFGPITLENGTVIEGRYSYTNNYTIMAVKGYQDNFSGRIFTNTTGIEFQSFLISNHTDFNSVRIINGNFYAGFTAYLYDGQQYNGYQLLQSNNQVTYEMLNMPSIFLFSAPVDDILTSNISDNNYHLIKGGDLAQLPASGWIPNGDLNGMAYKFTGSTLSSILYSGVQHDNNGAKSYFIVESSEGIF